jgi:hypothetical protein
MVRGLLAGAAMNDPSHFRKQAQACRDAAAREGDAERRALLSHMAEHWDALASLLERLQRRTSHD